MHVVFIVMNWNEMNKDVTKIDDNSIYEVPVAQYTFVIHLEIAEHIRNRLSLMRIPSRPMRSSTIFEYLCFSRLFECLMRVHEYQEFNSISIDDYVFVITMQTFQWRIDQREILPVRIAIVCDCFLRKIRMKL